MNLCEKSALELSSMLKNKECSSEEITASVLDSIKNQDENINAYITVDEEGALKSAKLADEKRSKGEEMSSLAGIPVSLKDNIITKGILTTAGSKILSNFVAPYDATVAEKLKANDMVILGKLNMDEFALGSSGENSYFKATKNPLDFQKTAGGSSSGCGSAIASNEAILTLGTDSAGGARIPASFCGAYALKPTYGSVSRYGLIASTASMEQISPIAKTTKDVALLYDAIKGYDFHEATSINREYSPVIDKLDGNINGLKIGIPAEYFSNAVDDEIKKLVMQAAEALKAQGAELVSISLPSTKDAIPAYYTLSCSEVSSNLSRYDGVRFGYRAESFSNIMELYTRTRGEGFGDEVKKRIILGTYTLSSENYETHYKRARLVSARISSEFDQAFGSCDIILTPTAPTTAFNLGEKGDSLSMYEVDALTAPAGLAGLPAMSVPCGRVSNMPVGMQLIGRKFSEEDLLKLSNFYETKIK